MIPLSRIDVSLQKAAQFATKGITCVEELAMYFPRKYHDFRNAVKVKDLKDGDLCRVTGQIISCSERSRVEAVLHDGTGKLKITWFGGCYFASRMEAAARGITTGEWSFCGKVSEYYGELVMAQPILHSETPDKLARIYPFYSKIHGMSDDYLQTKIEAALSVLSANTPWTESDALAKAMQLEDKITALRQMHHPESREAWKMARRRVIFDQMYQFYEELYNRKRNKSFCLKTPMPECEKTKAFIRSLPFSLTPDQQNAINVVIDRTKTGTGLNAMISGDVGCGKTAIALISAVLAWENGYQTIIMAPTLVLAKQHFEEMTSMVGALGPRFALLTSETKSREKVSILKGVSDGTVDVLIGTHSVLSDKLEFKRLGLTIIDEEHRFGANQKALLEGFDKIGAHHLSMTATPIPRSYASAVYGNSIDIISIETMPAGRKPVITIQEKNRSAAYQKLLDEVHAGHQGYVVCPFIEDSDNEKFQNVLSVKSVLSELSQFCHSKDPSVTVACISGDMKQKEILSTIDQFAAGQINLLVSTTIVEVGVNVPNATVIAIINAERFGLSALHQLRGRVGRKGDQGYCYLVSDQENEKLMVLTQFNSGFKIAEMDLQLRGPGDILGEEQTGDSAIIELILRRPNLAASVRKYFELKSQ